MCASMFVLKRSCMLAWFVCALLSLASDRSAARTLTLADLRKEVTLADPQISPDGRRVALLVGRNDFDHDIVAVQVVMVDVATGAQHPLAFPFNDFASVRWSPKGERIAFLAAKNGDALALYTAAPDGTALRKLADPPQGVQYFAWRPDGRAIAFATADSPPVRAGTQKFNTGFVVGDNDYLATAAPKPVHLWLASIDGASRSLRLTSGSWSLPSGSQELTQPYLNALIAPQHFPNEYFCWYEDSRRIAYTKMPDPYVVHGDRSVIEVLDTSSSANDRHEDKLTAHGGLEAGCDMSPDGSKIAYWFPREGKALNSSSIFVTSSNQRGANGVDATRILDRSPWAVRWMPDSNSLLILAHDGTREGLWQVQTSGETRRLRIGDMSASGASVSRTGAIAFIGSGPQRPTELYVMKSTGAAPKRLTNFAGTIASLRLGAVKHISWRFDGFDESGVLTYPPDFVPAKKYPLVLQIHGWPQYASQEAFDTDYPGLTQLFAAHGYVVFEPNYRGSDNVGDAFESAIIGDTVDGPGRDIMAGISAVEKLGFIDKSRIAVTGWSYGGLLTAWLIGQHSIWRAAMAGAAPVDEAMDYAISNYNVLNRHFLGRALWESAASVKAYADQSPITYAWKMKTPTLIMSCVYDVTVPVVHSYELFHALRDRGVPVEFVAYPTSDHYPTDPVSSEDVYRRWVGWLDRYLH